MKRSAQVLKIPPRHADGVFLWCAKHVWNLWDPQQNLKAPLKTSGAMHGALHLHLHCAWICIACACARDRPRYLLNRYPLKRTKLREAAAAQAAFRSSSTRLKGEPVNRRKRVFFCFQSEQKQKNVKQFKKVHLFEGKVFSKSFGCQVIFNLLKFQGQVNTTMEWQGWIRGNFSQISR